MGLKSEIVLETYLFTTDFVSGKASSINATTRVRPSVPL